MSRDAAFHDPRWTAWDDLRRPIWLFDPTALRGVYANASALKLWGAASREELLRRDFSALSPAVLARTERLARATAHGDEVSERWTFYPNGQPVTVQAVISAYRLMDGASVLLFEASPVDAEAEERRALEALRHTSTLIGLFDQQGLNLFSNPAAFSAYGAADLPFERRFAKPERAQPLLARVLAGDTTSYLVEVLTRVGRRWHQLDARPTQDPVTGAVAMLLNERDVTDQVEAQAARDAAERKAAAAEERQTLLTRMSHELRTPLNAVLGFSELLGGGAGLDDLQAGHAHRVHDAGQALLAVVNDLIAVAEGAAPAAPRPIPTLPRPTDGDRRPVRVLYVDDNAPNRVLVTTILTAQGMICQTADDGAAGVTAAEAGDWDVILMDIQMPVMNGVEATRAIRALPGPAAATPIVALTANTLAAQLDAYAAAGMDDCLPKPIDAPGLVATVLGWASEGRRGARTDAASRHVA